LIMMQGPNAAERMARGRADAKAKAVKFGRKPKPTRTSSGKLGGATWTGEPCVLWATAAMQNSLTISRLTPAMEGHNCPGVAKLAVGL
jgi:hypothetical protein